MRKTFLTVLLFLALAGSTFAEGNTPISGVVGCAPGLYYPETGECVVGLAADKSEEKQDPAYLETSLIGALLSIRDIIF